MIIKLKDWSMTPGPPYKSEGKFSAEECYEEFIKPATDKCIILRTSLTIDLDGLAGIITAFGEKLIELMIDGGFRDFKFKYTEDAEYSSYIHEHIDFYILEGKFYGVQNE